MTKKIKLLLGSLGATAAIVAVPVAVVACSSDTTPATQSNSNLGWVSTGLWTTLNPAPTITAATTGTSASGYKAIPIDGIPSSVNNVTTLAPYVTLTAVNATNSKTAYPIPGNAIVSNMKFVNGTAAAGSAAATSATITFDLGVFGTVEGTAGASGATTSSTTYTWKVTPLAALTKGNQLDTIISNLPSSINSSDVSLNINSANSATIKDQLFTNVKQYIWLSKTESGSTKSLGALIGSYSPSNDATVVGTWTWTYNQDLTPISIVSGKTIAATGIPAVSGSVKSDLTYLAQYLNMPVLNQYSLLKTTTVKIDTTANNSQVITISPSTTQGDTTYIITGTYASSAWTYALTTGTVAKTTTSGTSSN